VFDNYIDLYFGENFNGICVYNSCFFLKEAKPCYVYVMETCCYMLPMAIRNSLQLVLYKTQHLLFDVACVVEKIL
jgi:hypothetical protein